MLERRGVPCDRCLGIVSHVMNTDDKKSYDKKWHSDTWGLVESGKTCQCCKKLWDLFVKPGLVYCEERFRIDLSSSSLSISFTLSNDGMGTCSGQALWAMIIIMVDAPNYGRSFRMNGSIGVSVEDKAEHPEYRHPYFWTLGRTAPHLTVAEDRIYCAKDWLQTCEQDTDGHRNCQPTKGILPSRLVDLRASQFLRLVDTSSLDKQDESVRYATLSHSWGPLGAKGPLKTTRERVEAFGKRIPEVMLPKTFRDAVRITRSLGIPFLWIDSLCIIQDDPDEWQREASRMGRVYSGSILTISASCGRDSSSGVLPEDDREVEAIKQMPGLEQDVVVEAPPSITNEEHLELFSFDYHDDCVGRQQSVMVRLQAKTVASQLEEAHLSTRGWACQEQILSHRILHCLDSEIHWQCHSLYHTQSGRSAEQDLIEPDHVRNWCFWIQNYTNRNFTILSDRMPAFSGITELYRDLLDQEINLGVRPEFLSKDLSWVRLGPEKGPAGTGAPSWSWFSCNAPVCLDYWKLQDDNVNPQACTVAIGCRVDWTGPAMTSAIRSTFFRIQGLVMQMALRIAPESLACNPPYFLIGEEESDFSKGALPWRCAGQFDHESHPGEVKTEYTCLLLVSRTYENGAKHRETFLLLLPATETTVDEKLETTKLCSFRRVGIAMIMGSDKTFLGAEERTLELS